MRKKNDQQRQEQRHEHHRATVEKIRGKSIFASLSKEYADFTTLALNLD